MTATLNFACLKNTAKLTAGCTSASRLLAAAGKTLFVAATGTALALGGAATVTAQPGGINVQSGSSVDTDGTQGSWAPATNGTQRPLTTQTGSGHQITSDACYVKNNPVYCPPPSSSNPEFIQATTGTSDDPDSKLDPDGFQNGPH